MPEFKIGKTKVGGKNPCFIIAEIGINFDGKFEQAIALIDAAKKAGCNAVKFQMFTAEKMYTPKAGTYKVSSGQIKDIVEIVKEAELPEAWIKKLKTHAEKLGLEFFSSVCDEESVNDMARNKVSAYKVPSGELTHIPLLRHAAKNKKPMLISSGDAKLIEVAEAIEVIEEAGNKQIVLFHCVAKYPTPLDDVNLNVLKTFQLAFPNQVIGFSDHTSNPVIVPTAAVALGAKVIEKHVTLDRNLPGPDHSFALNPKELAQMVKAIRETEKKMKAGKKIAVNPKLLGTSERKTYEVEKVNRDFVYRSLFAKENIKKGEKFTAKNLIVLRPGKMKKGIEPKYYDLLIKGKFRAPRSIAKFKAIEWSDVLVK